MVALLMLMLLTQAPPASGVAPASGVPAPLAQPQMPLAGSGEDESVRAYRIPLELVAGALTATVAGATGVLVLCSGGTCNGDENLAGVVFFFATAPLGVSAGTTLAGYLLDGDGSYWASTLGVFAAGLVDLAILGVARGDAGSRALDAVLIGLPIVGASVGYELSSHAHRSHIEHLSLAPMVSPGSHPMAGLVLSGAF